MLMRWRRDLEAATLATYTLLKRTYLSCGDGADATEAKVDKPGRDML